MKKIILILTSVLLIICFSAFSASAADVSLFATSEGEQTEPNEPSEGEPEEKPDDEALPEYYSSSDLGWTTAVKSQSGDLCWAYSSTASFESYMLKTGNFYGYFSTDALDLWGTVHEDGEGWQRNSKEAGYTYISIGNFTSWSGPVTALVDTVRFGVTGVKYIDSSDRDGIKRCIMDYGAVTANLNYKAPAASLDRTAYYIPKQSEGISGHSVSVVGWDDNYSKDNFTGTFVPENNGAWLCKNSWGNNNSIGGYLWISYEDYYLFNDDFLAPSFAISDVHQIAKNDRIYQNEVDGATYEFQYIDEDKLTYFNVFDFSEQGDILDKVVFETTSKGAKYDVYYVPLDNNEAPTADRTLWTKLGSGTADYKGYICCDFDDLTVKPEKAAIAVELDTTDTDEKNGIGVSEWLRDAKKGVMIFKDSCKTGKSFFESSSGIKDLYDYYIIDQGDTNGGGTFVIKAITSGRGDVNLDGVEDINDVTLIQQMVAKYNIDFSDAQRAIADVNGDGVVNINDATYVQIDLFR